MAKHALSSHCCVRHLPSGQAPASPVAARALLLSTPLLNRSLLTASGAPRALRALLYGQGCSHWGPADGAIVSTAQHQANSVHSRFGSTGIGAPTGKLPGCPGRALRLRPLQLLLQHMRPVWLHAAQLHCTLGQLLRHGWQLPRLQMAAVECRRPRHTAWVAWQLKSLIKAGPHWSVHLVHTGLVTQSPARGRAEVECSNAVATHKLSGAAAAAVPCWLCASLALSAQLCSNHHDPEELGMLSGV